MRITAHSTLEQVAAVLAGALRGAGIRAVLTGGACAEGFEEFLRALETAKSASRRTRPPGPR